MPAQQFIDGRSGFQMRRMISGANGVASGTYPGVMRMLDEIDKLLAKPIIHVVTAKVGKRPSTVSGQSVAATPDIASFLKLALSAKHTPRLDRMSTDWDDDSLGHHLSKDPARNSLTLFDYIELTPELSQLKNRLSANLREVWNQLPFNSRAVLEGHQNIQDYLTVLAYYKFSIKDAETLQNTICNNKYGAKIFADYATVSAARYLIDQEQLKVSGYNDNAKEFSKSLMDGKILLSSLSFEKAIRDRIHELLFDRDEADIIQAAKTWKTLPPDILPQLVAYLQQSAIRPQINKNNIDDFLPAMALDVLQSRAPTASSSPMVIPDRSYEVQFHDNSEDQTITFNKESVLFAAQLYHSMVMGEELDVFGAVHYLAHRRMNVFGGMRIKDRALRDNLQRYVFDNQYTDLGDRKLAPKSERFRTRPQERQMFQRQVFDEGHAEMADDMVVNTDFKRLWKVLMLESARYLDRAQASPNPDSFVSRQNVMQAVEDLQYNLSTHCTGMATVVSPAIDAELNFVLERILKHEEILQQIVPEGGNWKHAVDKLNKERRRPSSPAMTLFNKAVLGKGIIEMIADYVPADFEGNATFSLFIGKVDAFITTQSILQKSSRLMPLESHDDEDEENEGEQPAGKGMPQILPPGQMKPANGNGAAPANEWDF
jgi:hypothetical protein